MALLMLLLADSTILHAHGKPWCHSSSVVCWSCREVFAGKYRAVADPDLCVCGTHLAEVDLSNPVVLSK